MEQFELNHGYFMRLDGWVNCWDRMPEIPGKYQVEDHAGNRFKAEAVRSFGLMAWSGNNRGYDICFWKEHSNG